MRAAASAGRAANHFTMWALRAPARLRRDGFRRAAAVSATKDDPAPAHPPPGTPKPGLSLDGHKGIGGVGSRKNVRAHRRAWEPARVGEHSDYSPASRAGSAPSPGPEKGV